MRAKYKILNIIFYILIFFSTIIIFVHTYIYLCEDVYYDVWSSIRLLHSFLIRDSIPLYSNVNHGSYAMSLYGPIYPYFYLLSTFFNNPSRALLIGDLSSFIMLLAPPMVLFYKKYGNNIFFYLAVIIFLIFIMNQDALNSVFFAVGPDAPGLSLSFLSLIFLCSIEQNENNNNKTKTFIYVYICSLAIILSVFSKQIYVILPFVFTIILLLFKKYRILKIFVFSILFNFIFVFLVLISFYGYENIILNLVDVPSRHMFRSVYDGPFYYTLSEFPFYIDQTLTDKLKYVLINSKSFFYRNYLFVFILILCFCKYIFSSEFRKNIGFHKLSLGFVSISMILVSIVTNSKFGGAINSHTGFVYFSSVLVIFILLDNLKFFSHNILKKIVSIVLFVFILKSSILIVDFKDEYYQKFLSGNISTSEKVYNYSKTNKGKAYFPSYPLEQYLAEGRVYPVSDILYIFHLSGYDINIQSLRKNFPDDLKYIFIESPTPGYHSVLYYFKKMKFDNIIEIHLISKLDYFR